MIPFLEFKTQYFHLFTITGPHATGRADGRTRTDQPHPFPTVALSGLPDEPFTRRPVESGFAHIPDPTGFSLSEGRPKEAPLNFPPRAALRACGACRYARALFYCTEAGIRRDRRRGGYGGRAGAPCLRVQGERSV